MSEPQGNFAVIYDALDHYSHLLTHCQFHAWSVFWRHRCDDTGEAFPSIERVARIATRGDRRHARRIIRELVSLGWLIPLRVGGGRNGTTVYRVCVPASAPEASRAMPYDPRGEGAQHPGGVVSYTPGGEWCATPRGEGVQHQGEGVPNTPGGVVSYTLQTDQLTNQPTNQQTDQCAAAAVVDEGNEGEGRTAAEDALRARNVDRATIVRLLNNAPDLTAEAVERTAAGIDGRKARNPTGLLIHKIEAGDWRKAAGRNRDRGTDWGENLTLDGIGSGGPIRPGFDRNAHHATVDGHRQQRQAESRDAAAFAAQEERERTARLSALPPDRLAELKSAVVEEASDFHSRRWADADPFKTITLAIAILAKLDAEAAGES